ncbi:50S ribosomal protein L1 [Candidatus Saccharibacteria bacterium]|nr:50S ribosomal protein L1 [Candidatus Saccharibacteria bacterium]MBI3337974.1 50S ribosomal protein L1 [Candidatus Saccharibacteria bacterium]
MTEKKVKSKLPTTAVKKKTSTTIKEVAPEVIKSSRDEGALSQSSKPSATTDKPLAKSGKRSIKAIQETVAKQEKEERKTVEAKATIKPAQKKPRTRLERRSKNYRKLHDQIIEDKLYELPEALELATITNPAKFDATVELHIRLGVDPKQADQNIRGTVTLPAGTGKNIRIAVFGEANDVTAAKKAGADIAGSEEFLQQLDKGTMDFDVLIATPKVMAKLGKYARILGPKGLMPNPKSGTVTTDVAKAVKEAKAGRVEYRVDGTGIIHLGIGKVSFGKEKLAQNAETVMASIKSAKPTGLKGIYLKSLYVTTSMGPSIPVSTAGI